MALTIPTRTAWEDRFKTPTANDLRSGLASQHAPAFELARTKLAQLPGAIEALRWHGVWKWTFEFGCAGEKNGDPFAFLVPEPARPRMCLSVPEAAMVALDVRKLPKPIREVLASAPAVDGIRWATWDLTTKSGVEEIMAFIHAYRTAMGGCAANEASNAKSKSRDAKAKADSPNGTVANGVSHASTSHKAGSNGTRRAPDA